MRTTQDRINILLSHFGMDRIRENMLNEELVFTKGAAFSARDGDNMTVIATFGFNSKSTRDVNHWFFKPSDIVFKQAFHKIENDESKYLQIYLNHSYDLIHKTDYDKNKALFIKNIPIFEALSTIFGGTMNRISVHEYFEEFKGVVSNSYEIFIHVTDVFCGSLNVVFNATMADLANDDIFLTSVMEFIKKYCNGVVTIDELKTDLVGTILKFECNEKLIRLDLR
jgi:hypothetical protein